MGQAAAAILERVVVQVMGCCAVGPCVGSRRRSRREPGAPARTLVAWRPAGRPALAHLRSTARRAPPPPRRAAQGASVGEAAAWALQPGSIPEGLRAQLAQYLQDGSVPLNEMVWERTKVGGSRGEGGWAGKAGAAARVAFCLGAARAPAASRPSVQALPASRPACSPGAQLRPSGGADQRAVLRADVQWASGGALGAGCGGPRPCCGCRGWPRERRVHLRARTAAGCWDPPGNGAPRACCSHRPRPAQLRGQRAAQPAGRRRQLLARAVRRRAVGRRGEWAPHPPRRRPPLRLHAPAWLACCSGCNCRARPATLNPSRRRRSCLPARPLPAGGRGRAACCLEGAGAALGGAGAPRRPAAQVRPARCVCCGLPIWCNPSPAVQPCLQPRRPPDIWPAAAAAVNAPAPQPPRGLSGRKPAGGSRRAAESEIGIAFVTRAVYTCWAPPASLCEPPPRAGTAAAPAGRQPPMTAQTPGTSSAAHLEHRARAQPSLPPAAAAVDAEAATAATAAAAVAAAGRTCGAPAAAAAPAAQPPPRPRSTR